MNIDLEAVKQHGRALEFVKEQTPEICLAAVKQHVWALGYVKEQTEEICLAAVKQNGWALKFVKEQTHEICLAAVKQNGWALKYVKEQTNKLREIAKKGLHPYEIRELNNGRIKIGCQTKTKEQWLKMTRKEAILLDGIKADLYFTETKKRIREL